MAAIQRRQSCRCWRRQRTCVDILGKGKNSLFCHAAGAVKVFSRLSSDMVSKQQFPELSFVVQDSSDQMIAQGQPLLTSEVKSRVTYMKHNFFEPQPILDASAFFIRQCVHNWPDQECIKILRGFVPALEKCKAGTPLLINDTVLPTLGEKTRFEERGLRQLDIGMMVVLNAKQRTEKEFKRLLKEADERFEVVKVHSDGSMGLVEVHLRQ